MEYASGARPSTVAGGHVAGSHVAGGHVADAGPGSLARRAVADHALDLDLIDRNEFADLPELECVRPILPRALVAAVARRARELNVTADRVILAAGIMSDDDYWAALADSLGVPFEPLDATPRDACPLDDARLPDAAVTGLLPIWQDGERTLVIAPRGVAPRKLFSMVGQTSDLPERIRVTSNERLKRFVSRHGAAALGRRAADGLRYAHPELCAGTIGPASTLALLATCLAVAVSFLAAPFAVGAIVGLMLSVVFIGGIALRVNALLHAPRIEAVAPRLAAWELPLYTLIIPLYREAAALPGLIAALDALDYPPEKLDIKIVVEADDHATQEGLDALRLRAPYDIVLAPMAGPRTKPKALNAALATAQGEFVAVFDAEDRPEADQLRRVVDAFVAGPDNVACLQAKLTIDNTEDSVLTRLFTAEYAGLFDVLLPGLAHLRLPLPLGGSSNHFRAGVLRAIGGWDAYNVTEDADLGMRLARYGYLSGVVASSTYEEAPSSLRVWTKQRTRWFKGWMQTWLVHMRAPRTLAREMGLSGFLTFQLFVGGTVLAALAHALFVICIALTIASGRTGSLWDSITGTILFSLYAGTCVAAYGIWAAAAFVGLARRGLLSSAWTLALMPVHWMMLSLAAWMALFDLVLRPHRWSKTEHGLARHSRLARRRR